VVNVTVRDYLYGVSAPRTILGREKVSARPLRTRKK